MHAPCCERVSGQYSHLHQLGSSPGCPLDPRLLRAVAASRQSFKEQEGLVNQQLAQLIRDGVWLKSYLAAVMRLEAEAFQQARSA